MPRKLLALLAATALAAAACGGGSTDDADPPEVGAGDGGSSAVDLKAFEFQFNPAELAVEPGSDVEVAFVNAGSVAHTFTAEDLGVDVEAAAGETVTATFTAPEGNSTVGFVCSFHSGEMNGTIEIGLGGGSDAGTSVDEEAEDYDY